VFFEEEVGGAAADSGADYGDGLHFVVMLAGRKGKPYVLVVWLQLR